jgi:peptidyl-prolyl cis-trans isomerase C
MLRKNRNVIIPIFATILISIMLGSCGNGINNPSLTATIQQPTTPPTDIPPTATSEPLAARVNGEGILLEDFNIELQMYQAAQKESGGNAAVEDQKKVVLDDLINNTLLAQEAEKAGQVFDETAQKTKVDELTSQIGGPEKLAEWKKTMGFSDQAFLRSLARNVKSALERDQIMQSVGETTEQVHVQQILVQEEAYANQILEKLKNGQDFNTLAFQVDPITGGELGWFPKGFIFQPEVEAAAFATEPGKFSDVVHSSVGYHILLVLEKDENRVLGPEARSVLQKAAVTAWVKEKQNQSKIEILLP